MYPGRADMLCPSNFGRYVPEADAASAFHGIDTRFTSHA